MTIGPFLLTSFAFNLRLLLSNFTFNACHGFTSVEVTILGAIQMALKTTFLASLCGTLLLADIGWSGECDCRPEIGNASAIVSDQCGKIWSSDRCTLKETRPELALASQAGAPITSILSASIQDLLRGAQVDPDYVDSVMEIISDNSNAIENVWASSDSIVLQGDAATAAVGDFCFVAISEVSEENLYISAHPQESSCSAWARLR